ncbi:MAG: AbrB/MazE/SpoVT family DNA-binding domain-containing protein [Lachnospiraceae bacterium]
MEQVSIKPWGNSQGIRIPKSILEKLNIGISDVLQIGIENDAIVLKKTFRHKTFEERVAEYDGEISICDFDWGDPIGKDKTTETAICEQVKLIDPSVRSCNRVDRLPYETIMNVSDAVQGIFEYD